MFCRYLVVAIALVATASCLSVESTDLVADEDVEAQAQRAGQEAAFAALAQGISDAKVAAIAALATSDARHKLHAHPDERWTTVSGIEAPPSSRLCSSKSYTEAQCRIIGCCEYSAGKCIAANANASAKCPSFQVYEMLVGGREICEDHNWNEIECSWMGCCMYENGQCKSAVGTSPCLTSVKIPANMPPTYSKPDFRQACMNSHRAKSTAFGESQGQDLDTKAEQEVLEAGRAAGEAQSAPATPAATPGKTGPEEKTNPAEEKEEKAKEAGRIAGEAARKALASPDQQIHTASIAAKEVAKQLGLPAEWQAQVSAKAAGEHTKILAKEAGLSPDLAHKAATAAASKVAAENGLTNLDFLKRPSEGPHPGAQQPEPCAQQPQPCSKLPEPLTKLPKPVAKQPEPCAKQPEPLATQPEPCAKPVGQSVYRVAAGVSLLQEDGDSFPAPRDVLGDP